MKKKNDLLLKIIITILIVFSAVITILFEIGKVTISTDYYKNLLIQSIISRSLYSILAFIIILRYRLISLKFTLKNILFFLICFLVPIANFPFSALIKGDIVIERMNLILLYILYTLTIALCEDLIFVGIVYPIVNDEVKKRNKSMILSIIITGLIFSFFHFLGGAISGNFGGGLYQAAYTLLIGMLLITIYLKTNNIYLAVLTHAVFDFGGLFTDIIANGNPHDLLYWIIMITISVCVFVYVLLSILKQTKENNNKEENINI